MKESIVLGAHTSASGGLENAIYEGVRIGANTVQLFTANQRQWSPRVITDEMRSCFIRERDRAGMSHIMSHASYLINLGSPKQEVLSKSRSALLAEIDRSSYLNLSYVNFHPGAALDSTVEKCLELIVESLLSFQEAAQRPEAPLLLLEMTAGQGSAVGATLEEIAFLVRGVERAMPIGVCVDTCHVFAAGYDISTEKGLSSFLDQFDSIIGLQFLRAMHLNDSKRECGSRVDRHASLGEGCIGKNAFSYIMNEPRLRHLPKYLETPDGPSVWTQEIAWLRSQVSG